MFQVFWGFSAARRCPRLKGVMTPTTAEHIYAEAQTTCTTWLADVVSGTLQPHPAMAALLQSMAKLFTPPSPPPPDEDAL